eukprot:ctg_2399.g441
MRPPGDDFSRGCPPLSVGHPVLPERTVQPDRRAAEMRAMDRREAGHGSTGAKRTETRPGAWLTNVTDVCLWSPEGMSRPTLQAYRWVYRIVSARGDREPLERWRRLFRDDRHAIELDGAVSELAALYRSLWQLRQLYVRYGVADDGDGTASWRVARQKRLQHVRDTARRVGLLLPETEGAAAGEAVKRDAACPVSQTPRPYGTPPMNDSSSKTPRQQGLYLPAEWHPHVGCWIGWPERADNWPQPSRRVHPVMVSLIHAIARYEPVTVVCSAAAFASVCAQLLPSREPPDGLQPPSTVRIVEMSCNDCWLRDTAPLFVIPGAELPFASVAGVDSAFNAWGGSGGGCYPDWSLDAQVARKVLQLERLPRFVNPMVLEGGSITVDGEGTLITTEQCLLNANRNPGWSRQRIEAQLRAYLGVECVLWLPLGIAGDADTDGHVDN